jgi:hypothetical protein
LLNCLPNSPDWLDSKSIQAGLPDPGQFWSTCLGDALNSDRRIRECPPVPEPLGLPSGVWEAAGAAQLGPFQRRFSRPRRRDGEIGKVLHSCSRRAGALRHTSLAYREAATARESSRSMASLTDGPARGHFSESRTAQQSPPAREACVILPPPPGGQKYPFCGCLH